MGDAKSGCGGGARRGEVAIRAGLYGTLCVQGFPVGGRLSCTAASVPSLLQFSLRGSEVARTSLLAAWRGSVRAQLGGFHQVRSNPSFKPSPNGKAPGPRYSAGVLLLQRGPGALPLVPV